MPASILKSTDDGMILKAGLVTTAVSGIPNAKVEAGCRWLPKKNARSLRDNVSSSTAANSPINFTNDMTVKLKCPWSQSETHKQKSGLRRAS